MNAVYRNELNWDWITLILFASLLLITLSKYFFRNSFFTFIALPFNNKYITLNKKKGKLVNGFHILMTIFQVLNLSLFAFLSYNIWLEQSAGSYPAIYGVMLVVLLTFLLVKITLQFGNGYFFENHSLMMNLIFEKLSYFNYGGLIAFLGNLMLIYVVRDYMPLVYGFIILILVVNFIGVGKIFNAHQKLITPHIFYFILYLCTLEIAPLMIFISYLNS